MQNPSKIVEAEPGWHHGKTTMSGLGVLLTFFAVAFVSLTSAYAQTANPIQAEIEKLVRNLDYIAIEPSSNVYKPGSFVHRRQYDPAEQTISSTKLGFLCTPEFSTARSPAPPIRREIGGGLLGLPGSSWIELDKKFIAQRLAMPLTAQFSERVLVRMVDQATMEYSAEHLHTIKENLGPICKSTIQARLAGGNVYQITGVYEFRLQFEVKFRYGQREDIKGQILDEMKRLGVASSRSDTVLVRGEVSVYGLAWDKLSKL
jgi:hypothetical protein